MMTFLADEKVEFLNQDERNDSLMRSDTGKVDDNLNSVLLG